VKNLRGLELNVLKKTAFSSKRYHQALEKAGALGIINHAWSKRFWIANKIFSANTKSIPVMTFFRDYLGFYTELTETEARATVKKGGC